MSEEWKEVVGFPNYLVSNHGRLYSNNERKGLVKTYIDKKGYQNVYLYKNGEKLHTRIHVLVAKAFISNPNGYTQVNHIDENKKNNKVENLEWCDCLYNVNYSNKRRIKQYSLSKEFIKEYENSHAAQNETGIKKANITAACRGEQNTAGGFYWEYC